MPELAARVVPPPLPAAAVRRLPTIDEDIQTELPPGAKEAEKLKGIGGWLGLLAIGQVFGPIRLLISMADYYSHLGSDVWLMYPLTFYGEAFLNASNIALVCYTSFLFLRCSKRFPMFFIYEGIAAIALFPVDLIFVSSTLSAYSKQPVETLVANMETPEEVGRWLATIVAYVIWMIYVKRSKRVANTFVW